MDKPVYFFLSDQALQVYEALRMPGDEPANRGVTQRSKTTLHGYVIVSRYPVPSRPGGVGGQGQSLRSPDEFVSFDPELTVEISFRPTTPPGAPTCRQILSGPPGSASSASFV